MTADSERALQRDGVVIGVAVGVIGMSFGLLARAAGVPTLQTVAMSVLIFSGGSQFLLVAVVSAGGDLAAGVVAALVLNARHIAFGLSMVPIVRGSLARRLLSSVIVLDESTAFALGQADPRLARRAFYTVGIALFTCWQIGTLAGALGGSLVDDPAALGLDAAFPAGLLGVLAPQLRDPAARASAAAGAALALLATPFLPAGGPILLAVLGAGAGVVVARRRR